MELEFESCTIEMMLRPTCYLDSVFDQYEPIAANDDSYNDCENLYTVPG